MYTMERYGETKSNYKEERNSSHHSAAETNPTRNHEVAGSLSGLRIQRCPELWCRLQTRLRSGIAVSVHRPAVVAPIRPLTWEFPHTADAALKSKINK